MTASTSPTASGAPLLAASGRPGVSAGSQTATCRQVRQRLRFGSKRCGRRTRATGRRSARHRSQMVAAMSTPMEVAAIQVGPRHRRDLGDVAGLAASIAEVGLLHPIVVNGAGELIAGGRRLEAAKLLG